MTNYFVDNQILIDNINKCTDASANYCQQCIEIVKKELAKQKKQDLYQEQSKTHIIAWIASYHEMLESAKEYISKLQHQEKDNQFEIALTAYGFNEAYKQLVGGIAMSPHEYANAQNINNPNLREILNIKEAQELNEIFQQKNIKKLLLNTIIERKDYPSMVNTTLNDDVEDMRDIMHKFATEQIKPFCHQWHLNNDYIPKAVLDKMSELGVFGINIPEEYGGMGLGKTEMCCVSTILSRANLGVGSLGTRADITAELINASGTQKQKQKYLGKIASGEIIPTVAFTEPDYGSDLANIKTKAEKKLNKYYINGNKTWITHAARANLLMLMARTGEIDDGYKGLSIFIIEKTPEKNNQPFPSNGIKGSEIEVIGYRGMKEFDMAFDQLEINQDALLGEQEGQGFRQLMKTFESARIQTAARATGVAINALDLAIQYALDRKQFGRKIIKFPRIADKILSIAAEITLLNNFIYKVARLKDTNIRCDQQAGMVKMIAAKAAWNAADNALQIHGGNGFAIEYEISRVLCDARVLSIFEGAAEIQAEVISRRIFSNNVK